MMNREEMKKITMEVITKREKESADRAKNFVEEDVAKVIEASAKSGKFNCVIFIPSHLDRTKVVDIIEENGFNVKGEYAYAEFEISWD